MQLKCLHELYNNGVTARYLIPYTVIAIVMDIVI